MKAQRRTPKINSRTQIDDRSARPTTDAAPRDLPVGWKRSRLGDHVARPEYGYTASATKEPIGPKFLRITDIQDGRVDWNSVPYCKLDGGTKREYLLRPGDIVVARIGATTGKSLLISECPETAFASYLIRIRTQGSLSPDFLNLFFETAEYWKQINENKGGRLKGGVNIPILQSLNLPLPPLPEQRATAHALRTVQQARATRQRELTLERERKAALMEHLFTHGTRNEPRKQTEIGEMPESWDVVRLGEVFEARLGKMLSQKSRTGKFSKPYVRNANVQWGRVDLTDLAQMDFDERESKKYRLRKGDILVCEGGEIARTAIWRDEIPECYFQKAIHRLRPRDGQMIGEFFLNWMERAFRFASIYGVTGASTTIAHIPQEKLLALKIPRPSLQNQEAIASVLTASDNKIAALEREARVLDELFRAMLDELMTGKLRVKE